ncbi:hypothetical protein BDV95DRAFT_20595 [Massariosphaeria phaeospora]|uniref:Uncharacterized protein n=1 Tax=Massariosphaeria phaeospora TaxID=100035 RepID=A0A7C8IFJ9_9PLEO|nr:hypothetical protein BDV95DRAFT_20595 [Massariosphaeria phaeospora]
MRYAAQPQAKATGLPAGRRLALPWELAAGLSSRRLGAAVCRGSREGLKAAGPRVVRVQISSPWPCGVGTTPVPHRRQHDCYDEGPPSSGAEPGQGTAGQTVRQSDGPRQGRVLGLQAGALGGCKVQACGCGACKTSGAISRRTPALARLPSISELAGSPLLRGFDAAATMQRAGRPASCVLRPASLEM